MQFRSRKSCLAIFTSCANRLLRSGVLYADEKNLHVSRFDPLDIGEVARRLGISAAALRLYEKRGLLKATRTASGYRQYSSEDLHRARLVRRARRAGLTLAQIEVMMKRSDRACLHRLLRMHLERLERESRRIERLRRHLHRWMNDASR